MSSDLTTSAILTRKCQAAIHSKRIDWEELDTLIEQLGDQCVRNGDDAVPSAVAITIDEEDGQPSLADVLHQLLAARTVHRCAAGKLNVDDPLEQVSKAPHVLDRFLGDIGSFAATESVLADVVLVGPSVDSAEHFCFRLSAPHTLAQL